MHVEKLWLTKRSGGMVDVDDVEHDSTGQVRGTQSIQCPIVKLGNIANDDSSCVWSQILKSIQLCTLSSKKPGLCRCIDRYSVRCVQELE